MAHKSALKAHCVSLFLSPLLQAPQRYVPTLSSQWLRGSPPTSRRCHLPAGSTPRTCLCSLRSIREAPSPHRARRPSASAASRKRSAARRAWRSRGAAAPSSPRCSWWAWRRSSRSRSTCPHLIGQYSLDAHTWLDGVWPKHTDTLHTESWSSAIWKLGNKKKE